MKKARLFWTGGWDSTFQLMQLLLIYDCEVTPFYMIDTKRPSTRNELLAMSQMKKSLFEDYPITKELLKPTKYFNVEDLQPDELIDTTYDRILTTTHLGEQYNWMAKICKQLQITDMHLSMEKAINPTKNHLFYRLMDKMDAKVINDQTVYRVKEELKGEDIYNILQFFYFPILDLDKNDMFNIAEKNNWLKILSLNWFCFYPTKKDLPCGKCTPCQQRAKENFMWGFPRSSRLVSLCYHKVFWPSMALLRKGMVRVGLKK